jgi:hypothetical protein
MRTDGRTDRQTDRQDEPNSRFSQFCKKRLKLYVLSSQFIYVFGIDLFGIDLFGMDLNTTSIFFSVQKSKQLVIISEKKCLYYPV